MIFFKLYVLIGFLTISNAQTKFMPNLPLGEYRMIVTAIYQCGETKDLPVKLNMYLSKRSSNVTEIRGNITLESPFDDSLVVDVNFASWSLTGGWKPNSIVYITNNGCSKLKNILGNAWFAFIKYFNIPTSNCPVPSGIYQSSGFDTALINDNNFPKVYFYGKYKYGEYGVIFIAIYPCESTKDHIFGWNLYFSKKSQNTTEIKGNLTFKEAFDDSFKLDINLSSWSLIGGWKKNSYVYLTDNACSKMKYVFGKAWFSIVERFNISNHCPIPWGTHTTKGIDIKFLQDHNFPKVYYYGKYKGVMSIKNKKNKLLGCVALEFNLLRPWEMPKY